MGEEGMEGYSGIFIEDVCQDSIRTLVRRLVLMLIRAGILVGEVVVVALGVISFFGKTVFVGDGAEVFRGNFWASGK